MRSEVIIASKAALSNSVRFSHDNARTNTVSLNHQEIPQYTVAIIKGPCHNDRCYKVDRARGDMGLSGSDKGRGGRMEWEWRTRERGQGWGQGRSKAREGKGSRVKDEGGGEGTGVREVEEIDTSHGLTLLLPPTHPHSHSTPMMNNQTLILLWSTFHLWQELYVIATEYHGINWQLH